MRTRIKERRFFSSRRIDDSTIIDEILIREDLLAPENAHIDLFFTGTQTSGILSLTRHELDRLVALSKSKGILAKRKK